MTFSLGAIESFLAEARAGYTTSQADFLQAMRRRELFARQIRALEELREASALLAEQAPPLARSEDGSLLFIGEAPGREESERTCPLISPRCPPIPPAPPPAWQRRARTATPEPSSASCAGAVLAWLRANWREGGHTNPEIATGVRGTDTRGWVVSTQLSYLYHMGLLQRRELVPKQPGGKYAYRARLLDKEPVPG